MSILPYFLVLLKCTELVMEKEPFIVEGHSSRINDFPHVAFLGISGFDGEFTCGSSILNQFILVTAAHCLNNPIKIIATVGSEHRDQGKVYRVLTYELHEDWYEPDVRNDLALIKLQKPLAFGDNVKRVLIMKEPPESKIAEVAGWGAVDEIYYTDTTMLLDAKQLLWNHEECKAVLKSALPDGTICGDKEHGTTRFPSRGDSGSGLIAHQTILIGVVSFKNNLISRSLVVYTDIAYFYSWIKHTAEKLSQDCIT